MAVKLTNLDISTRYALQKDFDNGFVGRDRQIVIQTDDAKGYRPIIMDGKTSGGKNKVALLNDIPAIATQAEAEAGTNTTDIMTPQRVKQAIAKQVVIPDTRGFAKKTELPSLQYSTTDLTAGSSNLATGHYYFVYE